MHAVIRMCSPCFRAITEPIMASHKNNIEASSSDQTSGELNKYRPTTPENKMPIHASTNIEATHSTKVDTTSSILEIKPIRNLGKMGSSLEVILFKQAYRCTSRAKTRLLHQTSPSTQNKNQLAATSRGMDQD